MQKGTLDFDTYRRALAQRRLQRRCAPPAALFGPRGSAPGTFSQVRKNADFPCPILQLLAGLTRSQTWNGCAGHLQSRNWLDGIRRNILRDKSTTSPHLDPLAAGLRAWRWSLREGPSAVAARTTRSKACAAISGGGRRRPPARPRPRRRTSLTLCFTLPASIDMICASTFDGGHCPKVWGVAACEARLNLMLAAQFERGKASRVHQS